MVIKLALLLGLLGGFCFGQPPPPETAPYENPLHRPLIVNAVGTYAFSSVKNLVEVMILNKHLAKMETEPMLPRHRTNTGNYFSERDVAQYHATARKIEIANAESEIRSWREAYEKYHTFNPTAPPEDYIIEAIKGGFLPSAKDGTIGAGGGFAGALISTSGKGVEDLVKAVGGGIRKGAADGKIRESLKSFNEKLPEEVYDHLMRLKRNPPTHEPLPKDRAKGNIKAEDRTYLFDDTLGRDLGVQFNDPVGRNLLPIAKRFEDRLAETIKAINSASTPEEKASLTDLKEQIIHQQNEFKNLSEALSNKNITREEIDNLIRKALKDASAEQAKGMDAIRSEIRSNVQRQQLEERRARLEHLRGQAYQDFFEAFYSISSAHGFEEGAKFSRGALAALRLENKLRAANELMQAPKSEGSANQAAGYAMATAAVISFFSEMSSLFSGDGAGKQSFEQAALTGIEHVSKQIKALHEDMEAGFKHLDTRLTRMLNYLEVRLNDLSQGVMQGNMKADQILKEFASLQYDIISLDEQIQIMVKDPVYHAQALQEKECIGLVSNYRTKMSVGLFQKCLTFYANCATDWSHRAAASGGLPSLNDRDEFYRKVLDKENTPDIHRQLAFLGVGASKFYDSEWMVSKNTEPDVSKPLLSRANPWVWYSCAARYHTIAALYPACFANIVRTGPDSAFAQVIHSGKSYHEGLTELRKGFDPLIQNILSDRARAISSIADRYNQEAEWRSIQVHKGLAPQRMISDLISPEFRKHTFAVREKEMSEWEPPKKLCICGENEFANSREHDSCNSQEQERLAKEKEGKPFVAKGFDTPPSMKEHMMSNFPDYILAEKLGLGRIQICIGDARWTNLKKTKHQGPGVESFHLHAKEVHFVEGNPYLTISARFIPNLDRLKLFNDTAPAGFKVPLTGDYPIFERALVSPNKYLFGVTATQRDGKEEWWGHNFKEEKDPSKMYYLVWRQQDAGWTPNKDSLRIPITGDHTSRIKSTLLKNWPVMSKAYLNAVELTTPDPTTADPVTSNFRDRVSGEKAKKENLKRRDMFTQSVVQKIFDRWRADSKSELYKMFSGATADYSPGLSDPLKKGWLPLPTLGRMDQVDTLGKPITLSRLKKRSDATEQLFQTIAPLAFSPELVSDPLLKSLLTDPRRTSERLVNHLGANLEGKFRPLKMEMDISNPETVLERLMSAQPQIEMAQIAAIFPSIQEDLERIKKAPNDEKDKIKSTVLEQLTRALDEHKLVEATLNEIEPLLKDSANIANLLGVSEQEVTQLAQALEAAKTKKKTRPYLLPNTKTPAQIPLYLTAKEEEMARSLAIHKKIALDVPTPLQKKIRDLLDRNRAIQLAISQKREELPNAKKKEIPKIQSALKALFLEKSQSETALRALAKEEEAQDRKLPPDQRVTVPRGQIASLLHQLESLPDLTKGLRVQKDFVEKDECDLDPAVKSYLTQKDKTPATETRTH